MVDEVPFFEFLRIIECILDQFGEFVAVLQTFKRATLLFGLLVLDFGLILGIELVYMGDENS